MSRGRLCRAQAWRRVPRSPSAEAEPGDTTSAACGPAAPGGAASPLARVRTNRHPKLSTLASGRRAKAGFAAPTCGRSPGLGESETPARQGRRHPRRPEDPQAPLRSSGRTRERPAPWSPRGAPRRPGSERRSRAGRERRSASKEPEARRPTEPSEPATDDRPRPDPRHRRRTAIPAKGPPSSRAPPPMGDPIRAEARGIDHGRRRSGAFAWQVSVARIPKVDKTEICSIANFVCISLFLLHKPPTSSPQSYPHFLRPKGRPSLAAQYLVACRRRSAQVMGARPTRAAVPRPPTLPPPGQVDLCCIAV